MEQFCIKRIVVSISKAVSRLIDTLEEIYHDAGMKLTLQKEYIHKLIMTMVSPVTLKIQYDLSLFPYILKPTTTKKSSSTPSQAARERKDPEFTQMPNIQNFTMNGMKKYQRSRENAHLNYEAIPNTTQEMFDPNYNDKELQQGLRHRGAGNFFTALEPQHEATLVNWIKSSREQGKKVTRKSVQQKAISLSRREEFKASWGWLRRFICKNPQIKQMIYQYDPNYGQCENFPSANVSENEVDNEEKEWEQQKVNWEKKIVNSIKDLSCQPNEDGQQSAQDGEKGHKQKNSYSYNHEGWNYENDSNYNFVSQEQMSEESSSRSLKRPKDNKDI